MKTNVKKLFITLIAFLTLNLQLSTVFAQGTAFTYQGRLNSGGALAAGNYDVSFTLFATNVTGSAIAGPVTNSAVVASNGLFTTLVDFGNAFSGSSNWLEIGVRTNGNGSFMTLTPRQQLTPTPYAVTAENIIGLTVQQNTNGSPNVIGDSFVNYVSNGIFGATIGGGGAANFSNSVTADFGTVGGGGGNTASGWASTVGGGAANIASSPNGSATVGGGYNNTASGDSSAVGGGYLNIASGGYAAIAGGEFNTASGFASKVGGGDRNTANGDYAAVGGGYANTDSGAYATVSGGAVNTNRSSYATIGGGGYTSIGTNSDSGTISGGFANQIANNTHDSAIGGGSYGSIGTNSFASTIAGGSHNSIGNNASVATIGGGTNNIASGAASVIGGGVGNSAINGEATVSGGYYNTASGQFSTVSGGYTNIASGEYAAIGGGFENTASTINSTIGGGFGNTVSGAYATVGGGFDNTAGGSASFAAGQYAQALYDNSFVWSDGYGFSSTTTNQFAVRATGGVLLEANVQIGTNTSDYHNLKIGGGNSSGFIYGSYPALNDGVHLGYNYYYDAAGTGHVINTGGATSRLTVGYGFVGIYVGGINTAPSTTGRLVADSTGVTVTGTFNNNSDRNAKENFSSVTPSEILDKVLQLSVSEWSYKEDAATRHVGPMAQDFHAVFNIGTDDKHIAPIDEGGVALAAIQGLNQKVEEQKAENAELKARLEKLEQLLNTKTGESK